jgi:hypothetical protein
MDEIPDCAISEFENPGPPELLATQSSSGSKSEGKHFGVVSWEEIFKDFLLFQGESLGTG